MDLTCHGGYHLPAIARTKHARLLCSHTVNHFGPFPALIDVEGSANPSLLNVLNSLLICFYSDYLSHGASIKLKIRYVRKYVNLRRIC